MDRSNCPEWCRLAAKGGDAVLPQEVVALPWSGSALGLSDVSFVSGRAKPVTIGVVGPTSAGKTTLLASWYLLLGKGHMDRGDRRFAGSYTLDGWEAVAHSLKWQPGRPPGFPPHTSSRSGRAPGLLHLAFHRPSEESRDYLFTDAPGEWFQKWTMNRESSEAEGARWIAEHADAFLLIADREALAGEAKGVARSTLQLLARRLAAERTGRPVALVWTKTDVVVSEPIENAIREAVTTAIPDVQEFAVSIVSKGRRGRSTEDTLLSILDWCLSTRRSGLQTPSLKFGTFADPLFVMRGK